ncbi:11186_t:CDS:2, partial [Cetraspora pellucida]
TTNNANTYAEYDEGHETDDHTYPCNNTNANFIEESFAEDPHNYWIPSAQDLVDISHHDTAENFQDPGKETFTEVVFRQIAQTNNKHKGS